MNLAVFDSFPPVFDTRPSPALRECWVVYITGTRVGQECGDESGLAETLSENTHTHISRLGFTAQARSPNKPS